MIIKILDPDVEYTRLLADSDKTKVIAFLRKEAECFIRIKQLIDDCNSDHAYDELFPQMVEISSHIRDDCLRSLMSQYGLFHFKQRHYLKQLLKSTKF